MTSENRTKLAALVAELQAAKAEHDELWEGVCKGWLHPREKILRAERAALDDLLNCLNVQGINVMRQLEYPEREIRRLKSEIATLLLADGAAQVARMSK